jgi:hypothetical protein
MAAVQKHVRFEMRVTPVWPITVNHDVATGETFGGAK